MVCQKGLKLSHGAAAWLRHAGIPADSLEGGALAWAQAQLPMVPAAKIPPLDPQGRTIWVTRSRPKIDRIACPWLIRRFIDPGAVFLFVPTSEVQGVAERFSATPFDIEGEDIFWTHRGEFCTFDVMVDEFGLATEPLKRLATIVRGADTARLDLAPEAPGLLAASLGCHACMRTTSRSSKPGFRSTMPSTAGAVTRRMKPTTGLRRSPEPDVDDTSQTSEGPSSRVSTDHGVSLGEAFRVWLRVAALSFGGPAGQIAVMHRILVEEKRWISESRFLHALNYCMLLPGPEAQQLATYMGWLMHRTLGGIMAGGLFILPGIVAIMG